MKQKDGVGGMQKKLFLCGPSGCGKTTMIRAALGQKLAEAGGFVTERRVDGDGRVLGFDLLPAAAAAGIEGFTPLRFLDYTAESPRRDNEVFRDEAVRLLQEAEYYPFAVLDEIGGFELVIPQFRAQLASFLSSPVPCVGVLKAPAGVCAPRSTRTPIRLCWTSPAAAMSAPSARCANGRRALHDKGLAIFCFLSYSMVKR